MENLTLIVASTQRQIGYVIAGIVLVAMATYWLFNWLEGRNETGAEIELAANRKPGMPDEELETKRLDLVLTSALGLLTIVAVALPLYWLGEPGRQAGLVDFTDDQSARQGEEIFAANCAQCHGSADGDGGLAADYSLVDNNGVYVQQVQWKAPSLAAVLDRYSYDEVKYILNYGRSNSPMPAWGGPGGGAMTDQQLDKVIAFLAASQKSSEDIAKGVLEGVDVLALQVVEADDPELHAQYVDLLARSGDLAKAITDAQDGGQDTATLEADKRQVDAELATATAAVQSAKNELLQDQAVLGEFLFNNPAAGGAYGCARCHSAGWSYDADAYPDNPLLAPVESGSGGFGPSLVGVTDQFETADSMQTFVTTGTKNGDAYGAFGQGDGGGQMPGFGACWAEDNPLDFPRIAGDRIEGHCDGRTGILTQEQIAAIVAYERSLGE